MKKFLIPAIAAVLAASFVMSASAEGKKSTAANIEASCKQQAAKKFSAIHFLKRRSFVNDCMAQHAGAKAKPATTTGQSAK